jgi:hypothetical protein
MSSFLPRTVKLLSCEVNEFDQHVADVARQDVPVLMIGMIWRKNSLVMIEFSVA